MEFQNLNLDERLMNSVVAQRFQNPTDIQKAVIPIILERKDLMASAATGAGKTLGFVLPSLEILLKTPHDPSKTGIGPRVVVLTPTRELANQVSEVARNMAKLTPLKMGTITGGVPYYAQEDLLSRPFDFLVATPGRLIDHMNRGLVDFSRVEIFVLDEADRMLDMGFMKDIQKILKFLPENRQILLFSATLEGEVQKISRQFLNNPECVQLTTAKKENTLILQFIHEVDSYQHKLSLLDHLLEQGSLYQAIIFAATKRSVKELASELSSRKVSCSELHGDMRQSKRKQTLDRLRRGQIRVLVATDVAARGLDIKNLSHVINFDLPKTGEDYIHRIGRTGRAGEKGTAISFVSPKEKYLLNQIERFTGKSLDKKVVPGLEPTMHENEKGGGSKQHNRGQQGPRERNRFSHGPRERNRFSSGPRERNRHAQGPKKHTHGEKKHTRGQQGKTRSFSNEKRFNNHASSDSKYNEKRAGEKSFTRNQNNHKKVEQFKFDKKAPSGSKPKHSFKFKNDGNKKTKANSDRLNNKKFSKANFKIHHNKPRKYLTEEMA